MLYCKQFSGDESYIDHMTKTDQMVKTLNSLFIIHTTKFAFIISTFSAPSNPNYNKAANPHRTKCETATVCAWKMPQSKHKHVAAAHRQL